MLRTIFFGISCPGRSAILGGALEKSIGLVNGRGPQVKHGETIGAAGCFATDDGNFQVRCFFPGSIYKGVFCHV